MRTWRLSLAGTVMVAMLGGMGCNEASRSDEAAQSDDADAAGTFAGAGSLTEARSSHTAMLLPDGRVLVVGSSTTAEVWDPATESFGPAGSFARGSGTATLLPDGRVLVVGGCCENWDLDPLGSVEVWDLATASLEPAGWLAEARQFHTATLLPDGRVLVVGGMDGLDTHATAEVWDPATGSFGPTGDLAEARDNHTATLLPDGRVLVVSGRGTELYRFDDGWGIPAIATAEVWDPATESFGPAGDLAEARVYHSATLLPDGRVIVIGGGPLYGPDITLAEAWEPAE